MNRWDIINAFIEKHNYKSYLEIGYYKGWSFDQVKCGFKVAVDPNPCKETWMQEKEWGSFSDIGPDGGRIQINKETSDSFFARLPEETKADIIFIDGLHEASQVTKDIHNALGHLSPEGTIVLHDCNPPKYEHTTTGIDGCWTGDTYKAFVKFRMQYPEYESFTIDTDWGCGVILTPQTHLNWIDMTTEEVEHKLVWNYFDEHRKDLLNLISVEEFKTKMNEGITNINSTTK